MQADQVATKAAGMMPELLQQLEKLVSIPSVAFPATPPSPSTRWPTGTLQLFRRRLRRRSAHGRPVGVPADRRITGPGSPVVMLYAHYDVQPAPPEQGWTTDPWTPTRRTRRVYGRGAADDKGGLVTHLGTMQVSMADRPARSG